MRYVVLVMCCMGIDSWWWCDVRFKRQPHLAVVADGEGPEARHIGAWAEPLGWFPDPARASSNMQLSEIDPLAGGGVSWNRGIVTLHNIFDTILSLGQSSWTYWTLGTLFGRWTSLLESTLASVFQLQMVVFVAWPVQADAWQRFLWRCGEQPKAASASGSFASLCTSVHNKKTSYSLVSWKSSKCTMLIIIFVFSFTYVGIETSIIFDWEPKIWAHSGERENAVLRLPKGVRNKVWEHCNTSQIWSMNSCLLSATIDCSLVVRSWRFLQYGFFLNQFTMTEECMSFIIHKS